MKNIFNLKSDYAIIILIYCSYLLLFVSTKLFVFLPTILVILLLFRSFFALVLIFFIPGYSIALIFNGDDVNNEDFSTKIFLQSLLLSISLNLLCTFIISSFTPITEILSVLILILPSLFLAFFFPIFKNLRNNSSPYKLENKRILLSTQKLIRSIKKHFPSEVFGKTLLMKIESSIILLLLVFSSIFLIIAFNSEKEQYTEFFMLSEEGTADYTTEFIPNQTSKFRVVVKCNEKKMVNYEFLATLNKTSFLTTNFTLFNDEKLEIPLTTPVLFESTVFLLELYLNKTNTEHSDCNLYLFVKLYQKKS